MLNQSSLASSPFSLSASRYSSSLCSRVWLRFSEWLCVCVCFLCRPVFTDAGQPEIHSPFWVYCYSTFLARLFVGVCNNMVTDWATVDRLASQLVYSVFRKLSRSLLRRLSLATGNRIEGNSSDGTTGGSGHCGELRWSKSTTGGWSWTNAVHSFTLHDEWILITISSLVWFALITG